MNTNFGKLVDGNVQYAPRALMTEDGLKVNPSSQTYLINGWCEVVDEKPKAEKGHYAQSIGWIQESETKIVRQWKIVEVEEQKPAPRTFSKLKVVAKLKELGKWDDCKQWIWDNDLYDLYLAALNFSEEDENFKQGLSALCPVLKMTGDEIEGVLKACVIE